MRKHCKLTQTAKEHSYSVLGDDSAHLITYYLQWTSYKRIPQNFAIDFLLIDEGDSDRTFETCQVQRDYLVSTGSDN